MTLRLDANKSRFTDILRKSRILLRRFFSAFTKARTAVIFTVLFYAVFIAYLLLVKHYNFNTTAWDLGIFSQSMYTTLKSNMFFYNNLEFGSHFHVHFSPILLLCLPFYAVYPNPVTLLTLQAVVVALSGVPLYFLAKREFGSASHSVAFTLLYFLYPLLFGAALCDFHPEVFVPLFGFLSLYFYKTEKWSRYFVSLLLLLMVKEDIPLVVMGIGFYGLFSNIRLFFKRQINKKLIISLITIVVGVIWLFLAFFMISHFVKLDGYENLWEYGYSHHTVNVYGEIGSGGPLSVFSYIISNPLESISRLVYPPTQKFIFLATLFLPLCMFAFLDVPSVLLFLPTLLEFMFASNPHYFAIDLYYQFQLIPTVFVATIHGIRKICLEYNRKSINERTIRHVLFVMLIATLITFLFTAPIIITTQNVSLTMKGENERKNQLISLIPLDANISILTQNDYFPHVSTFNFSYAYWNITKIDYILVDVCSPWYPHKGQAPDEYVAKFGENQTSFDALIKGYIRSGEFGLLAQDDGLLLYRKGYRGEVVLYYPYSRTVDWHKLYYINTTVIEDQTSTSKKVLLHNASSGFGDTFWYGPYIAVPPGEYEVKFVLKIANITNAHVLSLDIYDYSEDKILVQSVLTGYNFSEADTWQEFTLRFKLNEPASQVEFRGTLVSNATDVYLDYIVINQTAPSSNEAFDD